MGLLQQHMFESNHLKQHTWWSYDKKLRRQSIKSGLEFSFLQNKTSKPQYKFTACVIKLKTIKRGSDREKKTSCRKHSFQTF
jgi:hypothetical protein